MIKKNKINNNSLKSRGWVLIKNVYSKNFIEDVKSEYASKKNFFNDIQRKKNMPKESIDVGFHTIVKCPKSLGLFEKNKTSDIIHNHFNGLYILNTMSISEIKTNSNIYTLNIHRDIRTFSGSSKLWLISLIMLEDSNIENGATWLLEKKFNTLDKPSNKYFNQNAIRIEGMAGDVILFDGNLWHKSGYNYSNKSRTILTPVYSKPFIKQQFDYPKAFGLKNANIYSSHLRQLLGYNSLTPSRIKDFYQSKPENRFYKPDQV